VETWIAFIKVHERLILVLATLAMFAFLGNKYLNSDAAKTQAKADALTVQLQAEKEKDAQNATQTAQTLQQYQTMLDTLSKQNASLASSVAQRQTTLLVQQKTDSTLTTPDLVKRWQELTGTNDLTVTSSGVNVPDASAHQTVEQLEQVPVLRSNLIDEETIVRNTQTELGKANDSISSQGTQIAGLNLTLTTQAAQCKAEVSAVRSQARKSKSRWFLTGVIIGFVGRSFIK